jgi:hypothetical protein
LLISKLSFLGEKKHICLICDASFTKAWSLKQHLTLHESNPTNLQCHECDFVAPTKGRLQSHQASHNLRNEIDEENFTFMDSVTEEEEQDEYSLVEIQTY